MSRAEERGSRNMARLRTLHPSLPGLSFEVPMTRDLRVLLVEDSADDAELLLRELRRGGYTPLWLRVQTREELREALARQTWDIVLADYSLPNFSAPEAFAVFKETGLDLPFIIVSGTVGEETAVEAMRAGVHDYLLKDKLTRLVAAAERELREAALRAERRKMQQRLFTADRMVSVGTLAAGVAHEINSPLATVILGLEVAIERLSQLTGALDAQPLVAANLAEVQASLRDVHDASERVCRIAQDLRSFSWAGSDDPRGPVDVERVLESALRIAWSAIRYKARLVRSYAQVPPVLGSEPRLGQVFLNLLLNAAQAIPEGELERHELHLATRWADGRVVVEIRDTGKGIPADVLPRIFEAFFTTKPFGVGTGLGLTICQQIVTGLGGEIEISSDAGKGTTVRVSFPPADAALEVAEQPGSPEPGRGFAGRASILVVDDDPVIGSVVRRVFSGEHDVVAAGSVAEALERLEEPGAHFDVILSDMHMGRGSGVDLYEALARKLPPLAAKLAFMIGGAVTPTTREFLARVPNSRIDKPFDAQGLRALVREVLGG
jgi:signal transduction histidine kinase